MCIYLRGYPEENRSSSFSHQHRLHTRAAGNHVQIPPPGETLGSYLLLLTVHVSTSKLLYKHICPEAPCNVKQKLLTLFLVCLYLFPNRG